MMLVNILEKCAVFCCQYCTHLHNSVGTDFLPNVPITHHE